MNSNERDDMDLDNRLRLCILSGDNEGARRILQKLDPSNLIDSSGKTLLHVAAEMNNEIITRQLIDAGCKVDATDNNGNTPLILACQQNHTEVIIKLLAKTKASVLISNGEGKNAAKIVLGGRELNLDLFGPFLERVREECSNDSLQTAKELLRIGCSFTRAMRLKDTVITKHMLDNGCNINDQDHSLGGWTPLHQALLSGDNGNAKLLIDRGADVNMGDDAGMTPLSYAYDIGMLAILLNKGARVVDDSGTLLVPELFSCRGKEVVELLMSSYNLTDLMVKDRRGTTLFHHLISNREFDPVEILQKHFDNSIDINQGGGDSSPLFEALQAGNVRTVEFLLKMGAKTDARDVWLNELYHWVSTDHWKENRREREKILMLLLQYGTDIQWMSRDDDGIEHCNLDFVLRENHFTMAKIILARLALVEDLGGEIKNVYRSKIEHTAMCKKYFGFCKRMIEKLKQTMINRQVTLFDFMTCSEARLVKFARSEDFVQIVQSMMYHKRSSNLYYYRVLRKRVKKIVEIVDARKHVFFYVNLMIPALQSNRIIIEKIVEYIICDILRPMTKDPTFKCMVDNE